MKAINHLIVILLGLTWCSCSVVSKNRIAAMRRAEISSFSLVNFNGDYAANPNFCSEKIENTCSSPPSLWETLYSCKNTFGDSLQTSPTAFVNLNFDGRRRLTVSLFDSGKLIRQIELKASVFKNNLAIKTKLFLIPVPILFYIRRERKVLLANNPDKSLNVGYSKITEGEIIFGASFNFLYMLYFARQLK